MLTSTAGSLYVNSGVEQREFQWMQLLSSLHDKTA